MTINLTNGFSEVNDARKPIGFVGPIDGLLGQVHTMNSTRNNPLPEGYTSNAIGQDGSTVIWTERPQKIKGVYGPFQALGFVNIEPLGRHLTFRDVPSPESPFYAGSEVVATAFLTSIIRSLIRSEFINCGSKSRLIKDAGGNEVLDLPTNINDAYMDMANTYANRDTKSPKQDNQMLVSQARAIRIMTGGLMLEQPDEVQAVVDRWDFLSSSNTHGMVDWIPAMLVMYGDPQASFRQLPHTIQVGGSMAADRLERILASPVSALISREDELAEVPVF